MSSLNEERLEDRLENEILANLTTFLLLYCVQEYGISFGYEMKQYVEKFTGKTVPEGTLYPLISKLADQKYEYLESWKGKEPSERPDLNDKRIRTYYRLTSKGVKAILLWQDKWKNITKLVDSLLKQLEEKKEDR